MEQARSGNWRRGNGNRIVIAFAAVEEKGRLEETCWADGGIGEESRPSTRAAPRLLLPIHGREPAVNNNLGTWEYPSTVLGPYCCQTSLRPLGYE